MQSGSLSEAEEDDRPLLPKRKPRLLVEDDNEQDGDVDFIPTGQTAGRRGTQRNQVRDKQATLGTFTQRTRRGGSVTSDTYDIQPARSDTSKTVTSKAAPKATATRRRKKLVEDNDTTIDWGSAPNTAKGGKNSFASSGTATLDDDPSSTARKGTQKRKALAVNVDDDEGVGQPFFHRRSSAYLPTGFRELWEETKTLMLKMRARAGKVQGRDRLMIVRYYCL